MKEKVTLDNVTLIDDTLRGVYPFDKSLNVETEKRIAMETHRNPAYAKIFLELAEDLQKKTLDEYFNKKKNGGGNNGKR